MAGADVPPAASGRCAYPLDSLVRVMQRLLAPDGCPWDREQTPMSLRPYVVEEAYEVVDALESQDTGRLREELGDLLLQVVFQSLLWAEQGAFDLNDVVQGIVDKLIRRHPHVFGDQKAADSHEALQRWASEKARESGPDTSYLDGVPLSLPALALAAKLGDRAAGVGFDWPDAASAWEKAREEWHECEHTLDGDTDRFAEEWGDLCFALVNVARLKGINPEMAMRAAAMKFRTRFQAMEQEARARGQDLASLTLYEQNELWEGVKKDGTSNTDLGGIRS